MKDHTRSSVLTVVAGVLAAERPRLVRHQQLDRAKVFFKGELHVPDKREDPRTRTLKRSVLRVKAASDSNLSEAFFQTYSMCEFADLRFEVPKRRSPLHLHLVLKVIFTL